MMHELEWMDIGIYHGSRYWEKNTAALADAGIPLHVVQQCHGESSIGQQNTEV
jgi:hypothetical protein